MKPKSASIPLKSAFPIYRLGSEHLQHDPPNHSRPGILRNILSKLFDGEAGIAFDRECPGASARSRYLASKSVLVFQA